MTTATSSLISNDFQRVFPDSLTDQFASDLRELFRGLIRTPLVNVVGFATHSLTASADTTNTRTYDSIIDATIEHLTQNALDELNRYSELKEGWDGYLGRPIADQTIEFAQVMVLLFSEAMVVNDLTPIEITPGPASDGSLDIEISLERKDVVYTIHPEEEYINVYVENENGEDEFVVTFSELQNNIHKLIRPIT